MKQFCPITTSRINEKVARINSVQILLLLGLYVFTQVHLIALLVAIDFFLRGHVNSKYSIINHISKSILSSIRSTPKMINAGPKIFAAQVGFIVSTLIFIASLSGLNLLSLGLAIFLGFCASLEAFFGYCVACQLYPLFKRIHDINQ